MMRWLFEAGPYFGGFILITWLAALVYHRPWRNDD